MDKSAPRVDLQIHLGGLIRGGWTDPGWIDPPGARRIDPPWINPPGGGLVNLVVCDPGMVEECVTDDEFYE